MYRKLVQRLDLIPNGFQGRRVAVCLEKDQCQYQGDDCYNEYSIHAFYSFYSFFELVLHFFSSTSFKFSFFLPVHAVCLTVDHNNDDNKDEHR